MKQLFSQHNGAQVIGVTSKKDLGNLSDTDSRLLENTDMANTKNHLGMLHMFDAAGIVKVPFFLDPMKNSDYILVNGVKGKFQYDIQNESKKCAVVQNVEEGVEKLGVDGAPFRIHLTQEFRPNDILTYDPIDGAQVVVEEDSEVEITDNGFIHTVVLLRKDRNNYFPASKLTAGTPFYKIGNALGEFSTGYSGLTGTQLPSKTTLEYQIGSPQGVEVSYSDWANSFILDGEENSYLSEQLLQQAHAFAEQGAVTKDQTLIYAEKNPSTGKLEVRKAMNLLHALALAELYKMNATRAMFAHAGTITGGSTGKRVNEGIYPQLRRGYRFTYNNEPELRARIRQAADVIFSRSNVPVTKRQIKFKVGARAEALVKEMFKKEFINTNPIFMNHDIMGNTPLLTGDRYNKTYETFAISKSYLAGIGNVTVEHDPALDYDFGDYIARGYSGGYSKRSYSLIIMDMGSEEYSNLFNKDVLPKGQDVVVHPDARKKNMFLIKPKGRPDVSFGTQTGRMAGKGVNSVSAEQGETFWANMQMDAWIPDLSRCILIELADAFTDEELKFI